MTEKSINPDEQAEIEQSRAEEDLSAEKAARTPMDVLHDRASTENKSRIAERVKDFEHRTIALGRYRTSQEYLNALKAEGIEMTPTVYKLLERVPVGKESGNVEIVILSVADLGLAEGASRADIFAKAKEFGLDLCPAEIELALRLHLAQQYGPSELQIHIGTEHRLTQELLRVPQEVWPFQEANGVWRLVAGTSPERYSLESRWAFRLS
jgi:hypothetical protein